MAPLIDHLWQSLACLIAVSLLCVLMRHNSARLRLWLWRFAALKFLLPFALLYALGGWLGFPVAYPENEVPAMLVNFSASVRQWFAPAQSSGLEGLAALAALGVLILVSAGWAPKVFAQLRLDRMRAGHEHWKQQRNPSFSPPGLGFFKAALLTFCAILFGAGPLIAGAVDDQQWRRELLIANSLSLRAGRIEVKLAAPGMGSRLRVIADENGVRVRNANLRELLSMVYGVTNFDIYTDQMTTDENAGGRNHWLNWPRYDIQVTARVREPGHFDPYALRQIVTRMVAERFGSEVHVNGECQPPCGRYGLPLSEEPL